MSNSKLHNNKWTLCMHTLTHMHTCSHILSTHPIPHTEQTHITPHRHTPAQHTPFFCL